MNSVYVAWELCCSISVCRMFRVVTVCSYMLVSLTLWIWIMHSAWWCQKTYFVLRKWSFWTCLWFHLSLFNTHNAYNIQHKQKSDTWAQLASQVDDFPWSRNKNPHHWPRCAAAQEVCRMMPSGQFQKSILEKVSSWRRASIHSALFTYDDTTLIRVSTNHMMVFIESQSRSDRSPQQLTVFNSWPAPETSAAPLDGC